MTSEELVLSICASINDFTEEWKNRVRSKIASAIIHILTQHQWEFLIRYTTITTTVNSDGNREWLLLPENFQKEIALRRDTLSNPIDYISPTEYNEKLALSSTPYGTVACKYTISGDESDLKRKRIFFLDTPTSDLTIKLSYLIRVSNFTITTVPDEFIPTIQAYIIFNLTPPMVNIAGIKQPNPSYGPTKDHYESSLRDLVAYSEAFRSRPTHFRLDKASEDARRRFHP